MTAVRAVLAVAIAFGSVSGAAGQAVIRTMTSLETAVACAPPAALAVPPTAFRIVGAQDTVARTAYDEHDLLVIGAGSRDGISLNQQFFVRRAIQFGAGTGGDQGALTGGWVRVVAVADATSIAAVDHACGAIFQGDYIEPFVPPLVPADAGVDRVAGEPDFATPGHVLFGVDSRIAGGRDDLMLIDLGREQGYAAGARFAVYRNVAAGLPLASLGEVVVVSLGESASLVRITRSRDAVVAGDLVVPRK